MSWTTDVVIRSSPPLDLDECVELYRSVGWSVYADEPATLAAALAGSTEVVTAHHYRQLIGLARVISDRATICYLQDLLVHPSFQRAGLGRRLLEAALAYFAHVRQKVLLTDSEPGQRALYESAGYREVQEFGDGTLRAFVRFDR